MELKWESRWNSHQDSPMSRLRAESGDTFYDVGFHYGRKRWAVEAMSNSKGRQIFYEFCDTLLEAKRIAEDHAEGFNIFNELALL